MLRFKRDDGTEYPPRNKTAIGDIYNPIKGAPLSKADISEEGTPFLLYGELYTRYGEIADEIYRRTDKVVDDKYYSVGGDVVIPTSGETAEDISTATCVVPKGVILAGDLNIYRSDKVNGKYFSYTINHAKKYEIARIAQGASVVHIKADDVAKIEIDIPSPDEQQKIVDCLLSVDAVIADYEAQVENMQNQKKGIMQKLFSQEVRFKKDDGSDYPEWETTPLMKLGKFTSGVGFSEKYQGHHDLPIRMYKVSDMNLEGNEKYMTISNNTVDDDILAQMKAKAIYKSAIIFAKVGAAIFKERKRIVTEPFLIDNNMMAFIPNEDLSLEFLHSLVSNISFSRYAQTGALPSYNASDIGIIKVDLPDPEEQKKIADCLSAFDDAIDDLQKTVEHWKNIKKGLLQQLFV